MMKILRSRVGALIIIVVVAALAIWGGVSRSANNNYLEVTDAKCRTANSMLSVASHYPSVDTDALKEAYADIVTMTRDEKIRHKSWLRELDREFNLVYAELLRSDLTKDDRRYVEDYLKNYQQYSDQLTPISKFVLGV